MLRIIPDITALATKVFLNTWIGEVENKILDDSGLATTAILNTKIGGVDDKIPDVSGLVKKRVDYDTK